MTSTTKYPLYFSYSGLIQGKTFLADVQILGRALLEESQDSTWLAGVNPGCLAEEATDYETAYYAFRARLEGILVELAAEASDCENFREKARFLIQRTSQTLTTEWEEARQAVRKDQTLRDTLPIKQVTDPKPPEVRVSLLADLSDEDNCGDGDGDPTVPLAVLRHLAAGARNTELAEAA